MFIRFILGFPLLALGSLVGAAGTMISVAALKIIGDDSPNFFRPPQRRTDGLIKASSLEAGNAIVVEAEFDVAGVRFGPSLIGGNGLKTAAALEVSLAPKTIYIHPQQMVATRPQH